MSARSRETEPFFVVPKAALNLIRERVEGINVCYCVGAFTALRWLANDSGGGGEGVEATIGLVAYRAGLGYNTAAKALETLEAIGVLSINRRDIPGTKGKAPSFYGFPKVVGTSIPARRTLPASVVTLPALEGTLPTPTTSPRAEMIKERKERKEFNLAVPDGNGTRADNFVRNHTAQPQGRVAQEEDMCFKALALAEGSDPAGLTPNGARVVAVALAGIRKACKSAGVILTPAEIEKRAGGYRRIMPSGTRLSAFALEKHWAKCGGSQSAATAGPAVAEGPPGWRDVVTEVAPNSVYAHGGDQGETPWGKLDPAVKGRISEWCREAAARTSAEVAA